MLNHQFLALSKFRKHDASQGLKYGFENWNNNDPSYEGTFLRNSLHAYGTLKKPNSWTYEGNFYSNFKEGYAILSLANNSYFEGLFIQNQPFGPGILTYSNGRQDVGFWVGRKLVRLSRPVDFIVPRLAATLSAKMKLLLLQHLIPLTEKNFDTIIEIFEQMGHKKDLLFNLFSNNIYDPRSFFFDSPAFEKAYFMTCSESYKDISNTSRNPETDSSNNRESETENAKEKYYSDVVTNHEFCNDFYDKEKFSGDDICNDYKNYTPEEFEIGILNSHYKKLKKIDELSSYSPAENSEIDLKNNVEKEKELRAETNERIPPQMIFWNRGQLCTEMLKLIFRYRAFEEKLNFKVAELMAGIRTSFRNTGEKERICLQFLKICSTGPPQAVKKLLCDSELSEELMDSRGNSAVMFAVASDQREIIDILLDYGVNVNSFNDENLTPLNLCLLRRLALANGIYSWETAFLPPVLNETLENESKFYDFPIESSIQSLDRIVGDGMSDLNLSENNLNATESVTSTKPAGKKVRKLSSAMDATTDLHSQITILNFGFENAVEAKDSSIECTSLDFANNEAVLNMKQKIPTKESTVKEEFDKSVSKSDKDKYLFQIFSGECFEGKNESEKKKANDKISRLPEDQEIDSNLIKKLIEIDKTIEKLLQRGADPNISEIPRPTIHMAIFTKSINLVELFLRYGANPNSQLYSNEGLLTPLHVLVLRKSSPEYIGICELLLSFGANPEEETAPNFCMWEGEKSLLNEFHGRTPLQLLCMRPDLEKGDPEGNIIKIGLILAKVSNKKHFFNGHSCLTLAMLAGNFTLFENLLQSGIFDPNQKLGKGLGTALQVLLSTNLQRNSNLENRVNMCNLLISAGANALPKFNIPPSLRSSIKFARRSTEKGQKSLTTKPLKNGKPYIKSPSGSSGNQLSDHPKIFLSSNTIATTRSGKDLQSQVDLYVSESGENQNAKLKSKRLSYMKRNEERSGSTFQTHQGRRNISYAHEDNNIRKSNVGGNDKKTLLDRKTKQKKNSANIRINVANVKSENISKDLGEKLTKKKKLVPFDEFTELKAKRKFKKNLFLKKRLRHISNKPTEISEDDIEQSKRKKTLEKSPQKHLTKNIGQKEKLLNKAKRMYPKALRKSLLNLFGNYVNIDVNQFFLPYVVLRDGNLYYRFKSQPGIEKEQYSLI